MAIAPRCSRRCWMAARWRAGSPPSSITETSSRWPATPPRSFIHLAHAWTAGTLPFDISPKTPDRVPTEPILIDPRGDPAFGRLPEFPTAAGDGPAADWRAG